MNVLEHLRQTVTEILEADPRRVVLGEDVRDGGMLGLTREAAARDGLAARLLPLPLLPSTLPAVAAGLAMSGARPLVILPSAAALVDGLAALRDAAALSWRSGDQLAVDAVFLAPFGPGFGTGEDAAEAVDALLATIPRLRVLCVGDAAEASAMLRAAVEPAAEPALTVVLLPRALALAEVESADVPSSLDTPVGQPIVRRHGQAGAVFAWGAAVPAACRAVEQTGLDVAVIDICSLSPLPRAHLVEHARSGKLVIAHGGPSEHGLGAAVAGVLAHEAILHLDAPVVRVTGADAPLAAGAEHRGLPSISAIANAIEAAVNY